MAGHPPPWPPENIRRECRQILDLWEHPSPGADASPALLGAIRTHRFGSLLHHRFRTLGVDPPPAAAHVWKAAFLHSRFYYERHRMLADALRARLDEAGISGLFLKGIVIAPWLYDPPCLRPFSDLDMVVAYEDMGRIPPLLKSLGFEPLHRDEVTAFEREYIHALEFTNREEGGMAVELHHNPGVYSKREDWYMDPRCRAADPVHGLPTLAPEAHILFLIAHLYYRHHTQIQLIWLHDIYTGLTRDPERFDWSLFHRLALETGWGRGVHRVLSALSLYEGWTFPGSCRDLEAAPSIRELIHLPTEKLDLFFAMGKHLPTGRGKAGYLLAHLCPPRDVMIRRYTIRYRALWMAYYPLRWVHAGAQLLRWSFRHLLKGDKSA
jgi:hypothetical protein